MASLEAKLLGEKEENYCSSDEGDHEEDQIGKALEPTPSSGPGPEVEPWAGTSQNTGPKGVLRDWELYQQHCDHARKQKEEELVRMVKNSSLSCSSHTDDDKTAEMVSELREKANDQGIDDDLLSDEVLQQFVFQRMESMARGVERVPKFGKGLVDITSGEMFLQVIDEQSDKVAVVIHIYDEKLPECLTMNNCLTSLADLYPSVQFARVRANQIGVSLTFRLKGVPALLVYKRGVLIGNFVQLKEEFGSEFYHGDVENFLIDNGMIQDRSSIPDFLKLQSKNV